MSRPSTSDNSSAVGLFPFLAVLLCTMGALLVLLVVLAQRIGKDPIAVSDQTPEELIVSGADPNEVQQLSSELAMVNAYQQQLDELKQQGKRRLEQDKAKLSHSEDHIRRLEHELAQLSLAADRLKATEEEQVVDQYQAEQELARLEELIEETEEQLEAMREATSNERSYAVVPFKGKNGTYAQPIYIVCDEHGITLQPEGLRFNETDFVNPSWPGNPLAASLRASREYLNRNARLAGEKQPLDPYPLIIVKPKGVKHYQLARHAIKSWDSSYGYEFIDADWKLTFPDLPDPQLARTQQHAVMVARERLSRLARAAPSKFRGVSGLGGGGRSSGRGNSSVGPYGGGYGLASGDDGRYDQSLGANGTGNGGGGNPGERDGGEFDFNGNGGGSQSGAGNANSGAESWAGGEGPADSGFDSTVDFSGGAGSAGSSSEGALAGGPNGGGQSGSGQNSGGQAGDSGSNQAEGGLAQAGSPGQPGGQSGSAGGSSSAAGSGSPSSSSNNPSSNAVALGQKDIARDSSSLRLSQQQSIADARGSDWAVQQAMRSAVPIQRPIQVVVRQDQVALLPSRHARAGAGATGTVISLDQPLDEISDQFSAALKSRMDDWGLAGNGLYWRPVLELNVGPEAGDTANRLVKLLRNSGVDIRLPQTANSQTSNTKPSNSNSSTLQRGEGGHGF